MQAIKEYAATASRFDVDTLAEVHARSISQAARVFTSEQAKDKITGHAGSS